MSRDKPQATPEQRKMHNCYGCGVRLLYGYIQYIPTPKGLKPLLFCSHCSFGAPRRHRET
jgi:hypothetical protein